MEKKDVTGITTGTKESLYNAFEQTESHEEKLIELAEKVDYLTQILSAISLHPKRHYIDKLLEKL